MTFALLALVLVATGSRADMATSILDTVQEVAGLMNNHSTVLVDGYYGLTLAEVQLRLLMELVRENGSENSPIGKHIAETEEKLRKVRQASEGKRDTDDLLWAFINPDLWRISGRSKQFPLRELKCNHSLCTSKKDEDLRKFAMEGELDEKLSDSCIKALIANCTVSQRCWDVITSKNPPSHGYPLTHQLLYFLAARQLKCESTPPFADTNVGATIRDMCERILVDSKIIEGLDYPNVLRDLFTEEVVVCGMEGFREFPNREWIEKILSWKISPGCYPGTGRVKRLDLDLGGCSAHFSGLSAAALSIGLRAMMEDTKI